MSYNSTIGQINPNFKGNGFNNINPTDPFANQMVGKTPETMGYGVAGYNQQGLRAFSNNTNANMQTVIQWEQYEPGFTEFLNDYKYFLPGSKYLQTLPNGGIDKKVEYKRLTDYFPVDLDPVAELWHGRTRTIDQISSTLFVQRYASWLAFAEEGENIESEMVIRDALKMNLQFDMMYRVRGITMFHTTIMEASTTYGNGKADYASITTSDTLSYSVIASIYNNVERGYSKSLYPTVILDRAGMNVILDDIAASYSTVMLPSVIMDAMATRRDSFEYGGIVFEVSKAVYTTPVNQPDMVTGDVNTDTTIGMAIMLLGKYAGYVESGDLYANKMVDKAKGTVVPFDLLNQVSTTAYKIEFGTGVIDPVLANVYYYSTEPIVPLASIGEDMQVFATGRGVNTHYNRRHMVGGDLATHAISFENVTAVKDGFGNVRFTGEVRYEDDDFHAEMLNNPQVYKTDMILLIDQYYARALESDSNSFINLTQRGEDLNTANANTIGISSGLTTIKLDNSLTGRKFAGSINNVSNADFFTITHNQNNKTVGTKFTGEQVNDYAIALPAGLSTECSVIKMDTEEFTAIDESEK